MTRSILLPLLAALLATTTGCISTGPTMHHHGTTAATDGTSLKSVAAPAGDAEVRIRNAAFDPAVVQVAPHATVTWTNEDGFSHTVTPQDPALWGSPGSGSDPAEWLAKDKSWSFTFEKAGRFAYRCVPHSFQAKDGSWSGQVGVVVVGDGAGPIARPSLPLASAAAVRVVPDPVAPARAAPGPDGVVRLALETREVEAEIADGVTYRVWTFGGTVPGPMLRVREGDTVEMSLTNSPGSALAHSIDLHAVTGPGGGARATQTAPGASTSFRFQALNPGLYVYHCATPHVPSHVANGMYGLILVEPSEGLPPVDREFYVVQGEIYSDGKVTEKGAHAFDADRMLDERPTFVLMNGRVGALAADGALRASVNETIRVYFGVGAFLPSNFHVIGEIFDKVYPEGGFPAVEHVQTTLVPAGGATMVEFRVDVPGTYLLVDHSLTRAIDRGAVGLLVVDGPANPGVFDARGPDSGGSGH